MLIPNTLEYAIGGVGNRGNFKTVTSVLDVDGYGKRQTDSFTTVYLHTEEIQKYHATNKVDGRNSISGYSGVTLSEFLHFDFDSSDLESARSDAINFIGFINEKYSVEFNQFRIWFTGSKGFHVFLLFPGMTPSVVNAKRVRDYCHFLAKDFKTFDVSPYDVTRLWRIPNSINSKSGLFKIPLTWSELGNLDIPKIKELACNERKVEWLPLSEFSCIEEMLREIGSNIITVKQETKVIDGIRSGFKEGDRNNGLLRVAGLLHSKGVDYSMTKAILTAVNGHNNMGLDDREIENVAKSIQRYERPESEPGVFEVKHFCQLQNEWLSVVTKNIRTEFGFLTMDKVYKTFTEGELFLVAARSGVGKTTMGMELLKNITNNEKRYGLMVSLEMTGAMIFQRGAMMTFNRGGLSVSSEEAINIGIQDEDKRTDVINAFNYSLVVDTPGLDLEGVERLIFQLKREYNINFVVIDYMGYIHDKEKGSAYEKASRIAKGLKELAKKTGCRVMVLVQTSRASEDGMEPVKLHHLRDSGAIEESADYILGMWRDSEERNRIHCEDLKNRWWQSGGRFDIINSGLAFKETTVKETTRKSYFKTGDA